MSKFELVSKFKPSPDQQQAIDEIVKNIGEGKDFQTLWGVTGSGKTFTMANVIQRLQKPTLIIAHNKTLTAQLAQEFKEFFPNNAVHYFVSYYDYYQPEAYVAKTDTYIEKESTVNEEIDRLRHAATSDLLTRDDVIIVASVSCIYGIGDVANYKEQIFTLGVGETHVMEDLFLQLISVQFSRATADFKSGTFRVKGDTLDIFPTNSEWFVQIEFWGDEISSITIKDPLTNEVYETLPSFTIFPAKHTVTTKDRIEKIVPMIQEELDQRLQYYEDIGDVLKHERLKTKVEYDIEMMQEVGYVNGIENYSRFLDGRKIGEPPATLIDYFPKDYLSFIDESHMTFSQVGGMYAGDRARKENLVENGFRLPSAMDNRPLKFPEFETKMGTMIAVSATPAKYEIGKSIDENTPPICLSDIFPPKGERKNPLSLGGRVREGEQKIYPNSQTIRTGYELFSEYDPTTDGVWKPTESVRIIPQIMRPTGLLDPVIEIKNMEFMVDDIMSQIDEVVEKNERLLITTITKRSSEELSDYLIDNGVKVKYLHSEIDTIERLEILRELREGKIDVIVGVNLLREGLDLPEVSKICILDADKQGFLRSESALIQIIGRAARNENGTVYMYSEKLQNPDFTTMKQESDGLYRLDKAKLVNDDGQIISEAMRKAINMTYYRRNLQQAYNEENGIVPKTVFSNIKDIGLTKKENKKSAKKLDKKGTKQEIARLELEMDIAAANMEYEKAAELRDMIFELKKK